MRTKEQVVSVEYAKKLKEAGVPQEALFYWVTTAWNTEPHLVISDVFEYIWMLEPIRVYQDDSRHEGRQGLDCLEVYAAFTVAELGEILPRCYMSWATPQNGEVKWWCRRMESHFVTHEETHISTAATEADARANMILYLQEKEQKR